jgi:hypothetical protein
MGASVRLPDHQEGAVAKRAAATAPPKQLDDDHAADVLTTDEFISEITEVLITSGPTLTGEQIQLLRRGLADYARKCGWIDG